MADRWLVFGGWAISPRILRSVFREESMYVDSNKLMSLLVNKEALVDNWEKIIEKEVEHCLSGDVAGIAGWSTGAIVACALAQRLHAEKLVLLSATPSFCRRKGFRFGWKPGVLQDMREQLYRKDNMVVEDFLLRAGVPETFRLTVPCDEQTLAAGLSFLEQVNLLPALVKPACRVTVLHGREDNIVPYKAGEVIAEMLGTKCQAFEGGHAFFAEQCDAVRRLI
jgi:pimeloyl-ACP methyl ester carboxylesterase